MVPLSQGFVLPDKEKVVLLTPPLRAVTDRAVFCAYQPVTHPLDEQGVPDVQFCVHSLAHPPRRLSTRDDTMAVSSEFSSDTWNN
jgi:hypothetical protein